MCQIDHYPEPMLKLYSAIHISDTPNIYLLGRCMHSISLSLGFSLYHISS